MGGGSELQNSQLGDQGRERGKGRQVFRKPAPKSQTSPDASNGLTRLRFTLAACGGHVGPRWRFPKRPPGCEVDGKQGAGTPG